MQSFVYRTSQNTTHMLLYGRPHSIRQSLSTNVAMASCPSDLNWNICIQMVSLTIAEALRAEIGDFSPWNELEFWYIMTGSKGLKRGTLYPDAAGAHIFNMAGRRWLSGGLVCYSTLQGSGIHSILHMAKMFVESIVSGLWGGHVTQWSPRWDHKSSTDCCPL